MRRSGQRRACTRLVRLVRLVRLAPWLCVLLGHASSAHAADVEQIRDILRVEPGATCLSQDRLATEVAGFLEDAEPPADVSIAIKGSAIDPRGVRLHVLREETTVAYRTFEPGPAACNRLHAAVALATALALKASAVPDTPVVEAPEEEPAPEVASGPAPWSLGLAGLVSYRLLPEFAPGVQVLARRALGEHLAVRFGAMATVAQDVGLGQSGGSFDATLAAARAEGCSRSVLAGGLQAGLCLGLLSGVLYAAGAEVEMPAKATVPVLSLSGAVELEFELSPSSSLSAGLSIIQLLHRVRVGVEGNGGVGASSRALPSPGFALAVGPVYNFQ